MHSILTDNAETRGDMAALNFMLAYFRPVAQNLSVTMSLYSALTDSSKTVFCNKIFSGCHKTVFCFSLSGLTTFSNSEKQCSFILKTFRKSLRVQFFQ
jgi:hypothetical protein